MKKISILSKETDKKKLSIKGLHLIKKEHVNSEIQQINKFSLESSTNNKYDQKRSAKSKSKSPEIGIFNQGQNMIAISPIKKEDTRLNQKGDFGKKIKPSEILVSP